MYGVNGTIGLIVPSNNTVVEREFNRLLPEGYGVVSTRMWNTRTDAEDLASMPNDAEGGARLLSTAEPGVVAFACTAGSFLEGVEWERALHDRLEVAAGCPAVTTSGAFVAALDLLSVRRAVLATPYPDDINERERAYMESRGISVTAVGGLGIEESVRIGQCRPEAARDLVRSIDTSGADGVFISCTNFRTIDVLEDLENELGMPVVSSNQATLWQCLSVLGHREPLEDSGQLLRTFATDGAERAGSSESIPLAH